MARAILDIDDLTPDEFRTVLDLSARPELPPVLEGQGAALVFAKPSARTRNAAEMAVVQLGGHPTTINAAEIGIDTRESAEDVARTLGCYHRVLAARVFDHQHLVRFHSALEGQGMEVPVINLLSDAAHPTQALADLLTVQQVKGDPSGLTVAYVGDYNNVARSLGYACAYAGAAFRVGSPEGYGMPGADGDRMSELGGRVSTHSDIADAVRGADVVYTDVWASMGQESETEARRAAFEGWTITPDVMAAAGPDAAFLHCLPAHRGEEVSAEVMESAASHVWQLAENRMHTIRGLLAFVLGAR